MNKNINDVDGIKQEIKNWIETKFEIDNLDDNFSGLDKAISEKIKEPVAGGRKNGGANASFILKLQNRIGEGGGATGNPAPATDSKKDSEIKACNLVFGEVFCKLLKSFDAKTGVGTVDSYGTLKKIVTDFCDNLAKCGLSPDENENVTSLFFKALLVSVKTHHKRLCLNLKKEQIRINRRAIIDLQGKKHSDGRQGKIENLADADLGYKSYMFLNNEGQLTYDLRYGILNLLEQKKDKFLSQFPELLGKFKEDLMNLEGLSDPDEELVSDDESQQNKKVFRVFIGDPDAAEKNKDIEAQIKELEPKPETPKPAEANTTTTTEVPTPPQPPAPPQAPPVPGSPGLNNETSDKINKLKARLFYEETEVEQNTFIYKVCRNGLLIEITYNDVLAFIDSFAKSGMNNELKMLQRGISNEDFNEINDIFSEFKSLVSRKDVKKAIDDGKLKNPSDFLDKDPKNIDLLNKLFSMAIACMGIFDTKRVVAPGRTGPMKKIVDILKKKPQENENSPHELSEEELKSISNYLEETRTITNLKLFYDKELDISKVSLSDILINTVDMKNFKTWPLEKKKVLRDTLRDINNKKDPTINNNEFKEFLDPVEEVVGDSVYEDLLGKIESCISYKDFSDLLKEVGEDSDRKAEVLGKFKQHAKIYIEEFQDEQKSYDQLNSENNNRIKFKNELKKFGAGDKEIEALVKDIDSALANKIRQKANKDFMDKIKAADVPTEDISGDEGDFLNANAVSEELKKQITDLKTELQAKENELNAAKKELEEKVKVGGLDGLTKIAEERQAEVTKLQEELAVMEEKCKLLEANNEENKEKALADRSNAEQQIRSLRQQLEEQGVRLQNADAEKARLEKQIADSIKSGKFKLIKQTLPEKDMKTLESSKISPIFGIVTSALSYVAGTGGVIGLLVLNPVGGILFGVLVAGSGVFAGIGFVGMILSGISLNKENKRNSVVDKLKKLNKEPEDVIETIPKVVNKEQPGGDPIDK